MSTTLGVTLIPAADPNRRGRLVVDPEIIPEAFRAKVAAELADADARVRQSGAAGISPRGRPLSHRAGVRSDGPCRGCAGPKSKQTPGCRTCMSRHAWRRWEDRRKAALA